MRAALIQALRDHYPDADDAAGSPLLVGSEEGIPYPDPHRLTRLLLRALREHEQEIRDLRQRIVALEAANATP